MKREELTELGLAPEAVDKIMALHGRDVEKHKAAAQALTQNNADLTAQLSETQYTHAAENAVKGINFTSESAKKAFCAALKDASLPFENGALTGFDAFAAEYRTADPAAFATKPDGKTPVLVMPTGNTASHTLADGALRAAFGLQTK